MPHVGRIERDPDAVDGIARDEHGNALGGVRAPWLEAPRAQYLARCSCSPTIGEVARFDNGTLARLYPSDEVHELLWNRAVTRLAEDRLVLPEDAAVLRAHRLQSRWAKVR